MQPAEGGRAELTPEESWRTIHATMDRAQSSMYLAGTATILLLWGVITSLWFFSQFAIATLAPISRRATRGTAARYGASWARQEWWAAQSSDTAQADGTWPAMPLAAQGSEYSFSGWRWWRRHFWFPELLECGLRARPGITYRASPSA